MATIKAICISTKKGIPKTPLNEAEFIENFGIKGDVHAGDWHRQVSLLAEGSIEKVKEILPDIIDGSFAENLVISGLDLTKLKIGERLKINDEIILEITQIGKKCHTKCAIGVATGDCIMPKEGLFTKVISGGIMKLGHEVDVL